MSDFYPIPDRSEWLTIVLSPYGENPADWTFPVLAAVRGGRTKIFPKRGTIGPTDFDADDTLSTANWMDLSGGMGVQIINPSSDMGKTWWHVADLRGTDGWTCPPEAIVRTPETHEAGHVPVGRIGASTYGLWGTKLHKWNPATQTWGNAVQTIGTVVNTEGIAFFHEHAFFPLGSSGYAYVGESSPGTLGAPTVVAGAATPTSNDPLPTSNPRVWAFAVHNQLLVALTTEAEGYALAGSDTGGSNDWYWNYNDGIAAFAKIEKRAEPRMLFSFQDSQQQRALWAACRRGALIWDPTNMSWQESTLWDVPPHPDFGRTAKVFRPGEAVWIAGGGGDLIKIEGSGVVVPASGPGGANDGLPSGGRGGDGIRADKRGPVVSMASDLANLYLLVAGETSLGASDSIVEDSEGSDPVYLPETSGITSVIVWTGKGFHPLWESAEAGGTPTKIVVSDAVSTTGPGVDYRVFWNVGDESWSMPCRLTTHSSRQAVEVGTGWRFGTGGYVELGEFNAGTIAIDKLASHAALFMAEASDANYAEYEYRTDADPLGTWHSLGTATVEDERVVLPFGLSDDGLFSEGLAFRHIHQRVRLVGSGGARSPVVLGLSLAYLPLPQDAATKTYTIPLPQDVDPDTDMTREQIINKLESHVESDRFLYLLHQERVYRAYVAAVAETGIASGDAWGTLNLTVIQIPTGLPTLLGDG